MQKMITREIEKKAPGLYGTDGQGDNAIAVAHYFSMGTGWDWYMTEYDPNSGDAFGLVSGFERELGYFSIREFEEINAKYGFEIIERDIYWDPKPIGSC